MGWGKLNRWLVWGEWRAYPLRALTAVLAIALGVALGFAIDLINSAAYNEFSAAARSLAGQADLEVRGTQPTFDERVYPMLATRAGVAQASPMLELEASVPGQTSALKIIGVDVLRAASMTPDLVGVAAADKPFDTLADDAIFLSPAAMAWLNTRVGQQIQLRAGSRVVSLRVAGGLVRARTGQRLGVMDIGAAQWRFNRVGQLSRVALKLTEGVNLLAFKQALANDLQGRLQVLQSADETSRSASLSRAYRVNLNVLALVALFTGAFLVFSTQALSVIRRRSQFALLRVMGVTRAQLLRQVALEGGLLGALGAALGIAGGYALAATALRFFGADLGGGYFPGVQPTLQFAPISAGVFFALGLAVALLGSAVPAWEAARAPAAQALKSGSEETALNRLATPWPALGLMAIGGVLTLAPPIGNLPIPGYIAVALLLIGGIALMPRLVGLVFQALQGVPTRRPLVMLVLSRLANAPGQAAIALGGVLASFSLMVAMAIMVASFRVSVDDWLAQVLPADVYIRSAASGNTAALALAEQAQIAGTPGIARVDFLRLSQLNLDPARPAVALIARNVDVSTAERVLPLVQAVAVPADRVPIWVSEAMVDLYGFTPGKTVRLPLVGQWRAVVVAGVWRDYARQFGAIQMRLGDYRRLTGDTAVNDAGLWLHAGTTPAQAIARLKALPFGAALEYAEPGEIRAVSLKIFDRSFAVTYLLEAVAIVIGLFGVAATFSAQILARAKAFGMLRHIGVTRRQVLAILAAEGGLLTLMGMAVGFVLGWVISLILVFVVNPQSFHWRMQLHVPWGLLATVAAALLLAAVLTALIAGRSALSGSVVRAVKEDW